MRWLWLLSLIVLVSFGCASDDPRRDPNTGAQTEIAELQAKVTQLERQLKKTNADLEVLKLHFRSLIPPQPPEATEYLTKPIAPPSDIRLGRPAPRQPSVVRPQRKTAP